MRFIRKSDGFLGIIIIEDKTWGITNAKKIFPLSNTKEKNFESQSGFLYLLMLLVK